MGTTYNIYSVEHFQIEDFAGYPQPVAITESLRFPASMNVPGVTRVANRTSSFGLGMHDTETVVRQRVAIVTDILRIAQTLSPTVKYHPVVGEALRIHLAQNVGIPRIISEHFGLHESVIKAAVGLTIIDKLKIHDSQVPTTHWHVVIAEALHLHDALGRFFGFSVTEHLGTHVTMTKQFRPNMSVTEAFHLHETLGHTLLFRANVSETFDITATQLLKTIYQQTISESLQLTAAYVSPSGNFSTWAINTRTGAVTEYENFVFNSFAQSHDRIKYLGARSDGLYEINGDDDAGSAIIADIKSGMASLGGSHFSSLKAAYLGLRGEGQFYLKIITGTGVERVYSVVAQDMRTTKVNFGKGLRSRYFAFELISTGQDFDLDSIEFIPIVNQRRV